MPVPVELAIKFECVAIQKKRDSLFQPFQSEHFGAIWYFGGEA